MLQDLEELPEETLARHNFSGSMSREQGDRSDGEEYTSDSSDDDIDWEVMIRKANQNGDDKKDDSSSWRNSSLEGFDSSCQNATILSWLTDRSLNASDGADMLRSNSNSSYEDDDSNMSLADISTGELESSSSEEEDDFEDISPPKKDIVQAEKDEKKSEATESAPEENSKQETEKTIYQSPTQRVPRKDSLSSTSTASQTDSTDGFVVLNRPASSALIETDKTSADDQASQREPRTAVDLLRQQPRDISAKEEKIKQGSKLKIQQRNRKSTKSNQSKYDTLDRVQEYLLKTPISEELDEINQKKDDRSSTSTTITLSSSSSDDEHVFDVCDAVTTRVPQNGKKEPEVANTPARPSGALLRPLSSDSAFFEGSRSQTDNTSVWSGLGVEPNMSEDQTTPLDESLISEYKSCRDETPGSKTLLGRRLSYDSLERRMKFRLRTRNRCLRQDSSGQTPLRRSSSDRGSRTPSRSNTVEEKPPTPASNAAANASVDMVIIEMTPSVDKPLTPTAPPISRNQSEIENDQFYTPLSSATKSPPSWRKQVSFLSKSSDEDESAAFVSARSTPAVANAKQELPALPKVPHLEAISPTGISPNSLKKKNIDEEVQMREQRVKEKIEKKKAQQKDSAVDQPTAAATSEPLDASFNVYSPVPSRKKTSLKKRNRKSKSPKDDQRSGQDETGDVGAPKGKKQRNLFRFGSRKKKKEKAEEIEKERNIKNRATTLDRKYSSQSEREKAILRGERFRISNQNTLVSQTSRTDSYESPDEDAGQYWAQRRRTQLGGLTPEQIDAKIARRVQLAARRQARMEAQKRLRRAQVIQRQLEEVEVKQKELEVRGVEVEKGFRENADEKEESYYMQEWGKLVQEKNALLRYEQELMIHQRELQLEDFQSRLQQDLRERMALDDKNKSPEELAQEQKLLKEIIEVVEQRDGLVALLDEQRLKDHDEAVDIESLLLNKLERFPIEPNWSIQPRDSFLPSV